MPARLDRQELDGIRWMLGQVLVLVSLVGTFAIDLGSLPVVLAGILLVALVSIYPRLALVSPVFFNRAAPWLLLLVVAGDFLASGGDILPPLFRMVVILAVFRSIRLRTRREDLQLLLLTLFLLLLTGVLSLEITFGLQLMLYTPVAMGLLFAVNLCRSPENAEDGAEERRSLPPAGWIHLLRRIRERIDRATLVAGMMLFALTTGLTLLLFILLPRFDIGAALPFPRLQTTNSLAGFTDHVRYGDVTSILNDDTIAMRVDVRMEEPPARPYWRMVVLDAYYDGGFRVSEEVAQALRRRSHYRFSLDGRGGSGTSDRESDWTVYLEGGVSSYLPAGDSFDSLRFKSRVDLQIQTLSRVFKTRETNASTLSFRYRGLRFDGILPAAPKDRLLMELEPGAVDSRDAGEAARIPYPGTLLAYPGGEANRRILDEAMAAIGPPNEIGPRDFSDRLVRYLQDGRGYSLESRVPPGEADTLLRWLESGQPGHCELYAGAFVLLSRYAGHPARLVTGFAGGDWNGYENYFMVRNRHAHAWCEVYDPVTGWFRVDPTPGYAVDPGSVDDALARGGLRLDRTWQAYLDSLRILWFRRVIQFDQEEQEILSEAIRDTARRGWAWLRERGGELTEGWVNSWTSFLEGKDRTAFPLRLLPVLAAVSLAWGLLQMRRRWRGLPKREALIRRRAGRLLRSGESSKPLPAELQEGLERFRYGPATSWPEEPESALRRLGRSIRRNHAGGKST